MQGAEKNMQSIQTIAACTKSRADKNMQTTTKGTSSLLTNIFFLYECFSIKRNEHDFIR